MMYKFSICTVIFAMSIMVAHAEPTGPFDPIIGLNFKPSQIAFEKAPAALVDECTDPARSMFYIYAQTSRPEGDYMVIAGPVWTTPDSGPSAKPVLDPVDSYGEVILVTNGKCKDYADPDTLMGSPDDNQIGLVNDLARNFIDRSVQAYGGAANFLAALHAQGLTIDKLDTVLQPLVKSLSKS